MATIGIGPLATGAHVLYSCSCKELGELERMYFCRHCLKLRCIDCVSNEVESFFCPTCLESMPSAEARQKRNRCSNCLECPLCTNTLSVIATATDEPATLDNDKEPEIEQKNDTDSKENHPDKEDSEDKLYYLSCGFCRWTSRDIGLPDQQQSSGKWPEVEFQNANKVNELIEYYRGVEQLERAEKDIKIHKRRRSTYMSIGTGKISSFQRRSMHSRTSNASAISLGSFQIATGQKPKDAGVSQSTEDPKRTSEDILEVGSEQITGLMQRLCFPSCQPSKVKDLMPIRKHLLAKKSQRCKILIGMYFINRQYTPRVIITQVPDLLFNQENKVTLTIINPLDASVKFILSPLTLNEDKPVPFPQTAEIIPPEKELILSAKDDSAEFDYSETAASTFNDDPRIVLARRANRLSIYCRIIPKKAFGHVKCSVVLKYDGKSIKKGDAEASWIEHHVHLNLGIVSTKHKQT
ncbi:uncharacterized protein TRIADDRAFT_59902 [Trichoplax adhaerens]|uniref:Dynactin subunit 4 n=1 Tax=Trichoplax adhaerens TaxID=10228 RepID=B3S6R8_TRIAD|nr:hypothetical protein TRIADDRAFT_59902 [Trichoplax adhaerens]EDV21667.1 hypothetical protein TRIADDRAFT_59902 [Trichoplax adhaerens]|eukprot:XP_002115815.1 hypothetical protein TRIADDRAFT_59902 [Trichoplax adhaerens]